MVITGYPDNELGIFKAIGSVFKDVGKFALSPLTIPLGAAERIIVPLGSQAIQTAGAIAPQVLPGLMAPGMMPGGAAPPPAAQPDRGFPIGPVLLIGALGIGGYMLLRRRRPRENPRRRRRRRLRR